MFGRRKRRADVEQLDVRRSRYLPTGAEVFDLARDQIGYTVSGRTLTLFVERGPVYGLWFDATPTWDDGVALTPDEISAARTAIAAAMDCEGFKVDFGDGIEDVPAP